MTLLFSRRKKEDKKLLEEEEEKLLKEDNENIDETYVDTFLSYFFWHPSVVDWIRRHICH